MLVLTSLKYYMYMQFHARTSLCQLGSWGAGGTEYLRLSHCTNSLDTDAPFLELDGWDDFNFEICNIYDSPSLAERSDTVLNWSRPFWCYVGFASSWA